MKKKTIIIIAIVVGVLVILGISIIASYNGLARGREAVDTARSDIDTYLQRRADLIPNLVSTVKNLTAHEQNIVDSVTDARAAMVNAGSTEEKLAANEELTRAVNNLMVVVENYPEISSTPAYTTLMDELSGAENRIATSRKDYNEAVRKYNQKIVGFPGNIFAGIFGFEKAAYYEASAGAETTPSVGDLFG